MARATVNLMTTGMHCSSCSMLIDMTLRDLEGVESSRTDHADGSTVVIFDDEIVGIDDILDAIRGVGYDAEPTT